MLLNKSAENMIAIELKNKTLVPLLLGEPGIGKSSFVRGICEKHGWHFHELLCNQLAMQADLTGCRTVKYQLDDGTEDYKQVFFPHASIKEAIDDANANPNTTIVLFLDEINRTSSSVTSAILTLITARKIGNSVLPANIKLIAAGNDDGNIITLDKASITRFINHHCQADATTFLGLGTVHPVIESVLKAQPQLIHQVKSISTNEDGDIFEEESTEFVSMAVPRTIMGLNEVLLSDYPTISMMNGDDLKEYITAYVGDNLFTEAICNEIAMSKINATVNPTIIAPNKPQILDTLLSLNTVSDIYDVCKTMSDDEKSECINYMLYDKSTDYSTVIKIIMDNYTGNMLTGANMQVTMKLITSNAYNRDTYVSILQSGNALATTFKNVFGE